MHTELAVATYGVSGFISELLVKVQILLLLSILEMLKTISYPFGPEQFVQPIQLPLQLDSLFMPVT